MIVEGQWVAEKRGRERFGCEQPPYSIMVRGVEADVLPVCKSHGMGVIPWSPLAGGWLTGRYARTRRCPRSRRSALVPHRYDMALPGNQAKLEAAEQLAQLAEQAGISLIHLALAFVIHHPAVTAAIIGPRTMEQLESQLGADEVELSDEVLDRIDEIVPPGTNLNPSDAGWENPALAPAARRGQAAATRYGPVGASAARISSIATRSASLMASPPPSRWALATFSASVRTKRRYSSTSSGLALRWSTSTASRTF